MVGYPSNGISYRGRAPLNGVSYSGRGSPGFHTVVGPPSMGSPGFHTVVGHPSMGFHTEVGHPSMGFHTEVGHPSPTYRGRALMWDPLEIERQLILRLCMFFFVYCLRKCIQ